VYACILEEVVLDSPQEISTPTIIEIMKRVEMRTVIGFVVHFLPTGLFACSSRPLVDAALDHSEYKSNSFEWDGCEVFMKDNADVVLVLEPHDIDNFLDYGVSIWITWAPAKINFLMNESCLGQQRLRATSIAADALRNLTGVKLIRRLHGGFSLRFHVVEELHATTFELFDLS